MAGKALSGPKPDGQPTLAFLLKLAAYYRLGDDGCCRMRISDVRTRLHGALFNDYDLIQAHIEHVSASGRSGGIEAVFSKALTREFNRRGEYPSAETRLSDAGLQNFYEGRSDGRLDAYFADQLGALEYKAVRLPRKMSDPRFYVGQLLPDYQRLNNSEHMRWGFLVAFCYGPLVADCSSEAALYAAFHNQMFVDCKLAYQAGHDYFTSDPVQDLEWDQPWAGPQPSWAIAVLNNDIGAVAISAYAEDWSPTV